MIKFKILACTQIRHVHSQYNLNELKHINQLIWLQNLILSIHMHYTYRKMKKSYSFHILI